MTRSAEMKFRTDPELKAEVQKIFAEIGVSASDAFNIFLRRVRAEHGIPGALRVPNAETRAAMEETRDPTQMKSYGSFPELLADIDTEEPDDHR
jgi:DNA-damage-inducible protein J